MSERCSDYSVLTIHYLLTNSTDMPLTDLAVMHFMLASKAVFSCNCQIWINFVSFLSVSPGAYSAPYSQAAYDGGQAPYPLSPPVKPGYAQPPPPTDCTVAQPPYNPAYVEPPKTGY